MLPSIKLAKSLEEKSTMIVFLNEEQRPDDFLTGESKVEYVKSKLEKGENVIYLNLWTHHLIFLNDPKETVNFKRNEIYRKRAVEISKYLNNENIEKVIIESSYHHDDEVKAFCEGILLYNYQFLKYKSNKKENSIKEILVKSKGLKEEDIKELYYLCKGTCIARDLVNEPVIYLTAEQFSQDLEVLGKEAGFKLEVFNLLKIKSLKMGGLLAVNIGSPNSPTFNILEYNPSNAINTKPIILIGKGVMYDTGGLSLKPTPNSMDSMKSDMAGAAAVVGAIYAIAKNKLPVHVVGLIPATENRPDGNAITPGDVITMFSGKTVEILNTDAEGRLILADALTYAKKYNPKLVIDIATLTGAAARAIGKEGIVYMGNAAEKDKKLLEKSGYEVYERLVEFPLWEEYKEQLESDIADIKNLGGASAGAITAGIFLQNFVDYDWLHLDIAGPSFLPATDSYRGKNGTGVGVRLFYQFIKNLIHQNG
jgi:leucyl aminopeptidase